MHVEIDLTGGPSRGRTVADVWGVTGKAPNAEVMTEVAADGLFGLLVERVGRYGGSESVDPNMQPG